MSDGQDKGTESRVEGGLRFRVWPDRAVVEKWEEGSKVVVPPDVDGVPVVGVAAKAFHESHAESVFIPSSVELIGESCFWECKELIEVTFGSGSRLTRLEYWAFHGSCLKRISIPSGVELIGERCFSRCKDLIEVTFDSGSRLTRLEVGAFSGSGLKRISIPSGVEFIGKYCFSGCKDLIEITFDSGSRLTRLEQRAFRSSGLKRIAIPGSVEFIGKYCFSRCKDLIEVTFDSGSRLIRLEESAFSDSSLQRISIPSHVELIGNWCFSGCKDLIEVTFDSGSRLIRLEQWAFSGSGLQHISIPGSVELIGEGCFSDCKDLIEVTFDSGSRLTRLEECAFSDSGLQRISIPSHVELIGEECFSGCKDLIEVTFDSGSRLTRLEESAFSDSGLQHISIPSHVELIGEGCFSDCKDLIEVIFDFGSRLTRLEQRAFRSSGLKRISIPNRVEFIGERCFSCCEQLQDVFVAGAFPRIQKQVFQECSSLSQFSTAEDESRLCPDGNLVVDKTTKTLVYCFGKKSVFTIPVDIKVLGAHCFGSAEKIKQVKFHSKGVLTRIESDAFEGCSLESLEIPKTVTFVHATAVRSIRKVTVSKSNKRLRIVKGFLIEGEEQKALVYLNDDRSVTVPAFVSVLGESCFCRCRSLEEIGFEADSKLSRIESESFLGTQLRRITIPKGVSYIHSSVLKDIELSELYVANGNPHFVVNERCLVQKSTQTLVRYLGADSKVIITASIEVLGDYCFHGNKSLEEVAFEPESRLTRMGRYVFGTSEIKKITIPKSVEVVEPECFSDSHFSEVRFAPGSRLKRIEPDAFRLPFRCRFELDAQDLKFVSRWAFKSSRQFDAIKSNVQFEEWRERWKNGVCEDFEWVARERVVESVPISASRGIEGSVVSDVSRSSSGKGMENRNSSDWLLDIGEYVRVGKIGQGAFGSVDLYRNRKDDSIQVAVKSIPCDGWKEYNERSFEREIDGLIKLCHPCILRFVGYQLPTSCDSPVVNIVTEFMSGGSLKEVLAENPSWFDETARTIIVTGMVLGVSYMHKQGVIHRDLKPGNILLDERHLIRIGDFGLSRSESDDRTLTTGVGTPWYNAPEAYDDTVGYSNKADVFSFGLILYEIVTGVKFFDGLSKVQVMRRLMNYERQSLDIVGVSEFTRDLIERCLSKDTTDRPTFAEIFSELERVDFQVVDGTDADSVRNYVRWVRENE